MIDVYDTFHMLGLLLYLLIAIVYICFIVNYGIVEDT